MLKKGDDYCQSLKKFPEIYSFLEKRKIQEIEKLDSIWRQQNLLLKIKCNDSTYVFKEIADEGKNTEMPRMQALKKEYPNLLPELFVFEGNAYLMEFVKGPTFFKLTTKQKIDYMQKAGEKLNDSYLRQNISHVDLRETIKNSLETYFHKANEFFSEDEFPKVDLEIFKEVPDQLSHGDLNAANLIYGEEIKIIDPADKGFSDVAKDVGRYCASCFFNHYDYFGNNKKESLEIAEAFLQSFDDATLQRTKYYVGESFLSFIRFHTETTPKSVLKKLATNVLQKEGGIISLLEENL